MNTLSWMIDDSFSTRLTLALLHFLWQGCSAGLVVYFGEFLLRNASARIRYSLNVAVMLAMAACLPTTFFLVSTTNSVFDAPQISGASHRIDDSQIPFASFERSAKSDAEQFTADPTEGLRPNESIAANTRSGPEALLATDTVTQTTWLEFVASNVQTVFPVFSRWIAALYFCGVAVILGRLMRGVWGGRQLRKMATVITETALLESVRRLAHQVGLKAAPTVAWCSQISIPVVVGVMQPMILLPTAIVSGLTPVQLQALLLHELSHIHRLDPIVNLLQRIIEAILFFHPVVWFVSRRISCERENAADDMVLAAGWDRPLYADALVRVAELASALSKPDTALRATILSSTGTTPSEFKLRILRLLGSRPPKLNVSRAGFTMALALLIVAASGLLAWSQSSQSNKSSDKNLSTEDTAETPQTSNHPADKLKQPVRADELLETELLGKLVRGGKIETKMINAWITLIAARGAQDAEFARLVLAEFEKSYDGGDLPSQSRRLLLTVLTDIFEAWSSPGWRSQLRRFRPDDLPQNVVPQADAKLEREMLVRVIEHGYETDRSEIANFSLAVRQLHDPAGREFLRDVLRNPGSESNPYAPSSLPETVPQQQQQTTPAPAGNSDTPKVSRWKDNIGGGWTDAKFVAAVGLAELNEAEGIDWLLARAQPNDFGIDQSLRSFPHIRDSRGSLRESSRLSLADLLGFPADVTVTELGDWWRNNRATFTARPAMLKPRAGSGPPDPALGPFASLANVEEEANQPNNGTGDLRSNPAARSGDTRRVPKAAAPARYDAPGDGAIEKIQKRVAIQDVVRGVDFLRVEEVGFEEALLRTPELHVPDPKNPGTWDRPKNVFPMPLGEHTWLKYPAGSGHFYIEHRPDGSPDSELLYGPIEGDPFEVLKLDDFFLEKLKFDSNIGSSDAVYRLRLMFRTAEPSLMQRAWQFIEPVLSRKFSNRNEPGFFERLAILEIARDGLREQVAANKSAELVDLGKRMREVIGAAEASVDAINDSVPDASYQSATYLQPKIQAQLPDALWGKPVSGLRLGLVPRESGPDSEWDALPADASLPTTIRIKPGDSLHYRLMVENVSDAEIKFCGYVGGEEMARSIEILDHKDQPARIDSLHTDLPHFISHWRLKPRERMLLTIPAIHFRPVSLDSPTKGLGYHVTAANGRYSLRCSYHFGDLDTSRQRHIPGTTEWIGQLTTGTQTITVGAGKDDDATAPPDGLEFLKPYPKLHGLSLDMTEPQFLEIVKQQSGSKGQIHPLGTVHGSDFDKDANHRR